jgi:hypothetical protein
MEADNMDIYSPKGTKVKFTANGGYDLEIERSKKILSLNSIYTVSRVDVGDWYSSVVLEEFPDESFNTVLFEKVA